MTFALFKMSISILKDCSTLEEFNDKVKRIKRDNRDAIKGKGEIQ